MKSIKIFLIEYVRIMLYTIIILFVMFSLFVPVIFEFSLVTFILYYLIFIIPLIWIILMYGFPKLENIYERVKMDNYNQI